MGQQIIGKLEILDSQNKVRINLIGDQSGESHFIINNKSGGATFCYSGDRGFLTLGGNGVDGDFIIQDEKGNEMLHFRGKSDIGLYLMHSLIIGTGQYNGFLYVKDKSDKCTIYMDGEMAGVELGREGLGGALTILNEKKNYILLARSIENKGLLRIGAPEYGGTLVIAGTNGHENIELDGEGILKMKCNSKLLFYNTQGKENLIIDGLNSDICLGGNGSDGDIIIKDINGKTTIHLDGEAGDISLGGDGRDGDIFINNSKGKTTIHLDGEEGDIKLLGSDCAEDFLICGNANMGNVMVIDENGSLSPCNMPYDKKVAGVISGAGNYHPGIHLGKLHDSKDDRKPLALIGKVNCLVDADFCPVEAGDLLTTSSTKGFAMKASDPVKAFGCILGKALKPLTKGKGLIPILVTLQ